MAAISKHFVRGMCAAAAAGALAMAGAAHADVTWNITGTFNDGGKLTGTLAVNQYDFLLNNFHLTTTAGSLKSASPTPLQTPTTPTPT